MLRPLAHIMPPFAVIEHHGRRSGRPYRTPVFAFRRGSEVIVVLSYGRNSQWVQNLEAAGGGGLIRARHRYELTNPQVRTVAQSGPLSRLGRFATTFADHVLIAELANNDAFGSSDKANS
jgi:deazaflavin-dependent oxidoreductase (nitroreductase family)